MDRQERPPRHEVVHLGPRRRAKRRVEGAYTGYDNEFWRGNRGAPIGILVPYHLDEHEPELEPASEEFDEIVHGEFAGDSTWARIGALNEALAERVARELTADGVPVVQSGCCTSALGTVAGMQRAGEDPAVIWFDAHGDLHTPQTSTSGYPGGMVLRQLLGDGDRTVTDRLGLQPVREDDVVLVDARDLDPPEAEFLASSAVRHVRVDEVAGLALPRPPYYLHVDLDVLSPPDVPGARFPVPAGPTAEELVAALRVLLATHEVSAVGLACTWRRNVRPSRAARVVAEVLRTGVER
jgi:arginase